MYKVTGKIFLCGIIFAVIAWVIHTIESILSMSFYTDPNYFSVWSKLMMPTAGPPPASFMVYSLLFSFIGGVLFALVYDVVKNSIKEKTTLDTGAFYGLLVFLIAGIPLSLTMILLINLPLALILIWAVSGLIVYIINGIIVAKLLK